MQATHLLMTAALAVAGLFPLPAAAQLGHGHAGSVTVAQAPRLHFSAAEMALAAAVADDLDLAAFYGRNGLRMVFEGAAGESRRGAVRDAVAAAPRHGIPTSRYQPEGLAALQDGLEAELAYARTLSRLLKDLTGGVLVPSRVDPEIKREASARPVAALMAEFVAAADPASVVAAAAPRHPAYRQLQDALVGRAELTIPAHLPRVPEGLWRVGMRSPDLPLMRARLQAMGFDAPVAEPSLYDASLAEAVARFQDAAGLPSDGIAGPQTIRRLNGDGPSGRDQRQRAIMVALERLRWMGDQDFAGRYVWVNIPDYSTTVITDGAEAFRTRSVVGKDTAEMRTPEFSDVMSHLVVNPSWNVPRSITNRDYLPKLRANPNALAHLDVVDGRGNVVPRAQVNFNAGSFPYRLRQKPSADNALGEVKFIFPNQWNIYLHDTPTRHLFGQSMRAHSNGCIRLQDPVDLAQTLLSVQSADPAAVYRRAKDSGRETWLTLRPGVPVHLVYFTAWPDASGQVRMLPDVYGRDARVWQALEAEGFGTGS